ncbi:unnamed protein product [Triticum turgidum subsp. durum]|uniref:AP2/ERF domain-containing protein n=1 Tax=Triticum turgidum subsp. durum TaxID=4567 RepID=A0A9R0TWI1_TRITD|nr:unnamed protein product [Triticum turgidum subsp. durum]
MAPSCKSSFGYNGRRRWPSDSYGAVFQHTDNQYWLDTFTLANIVARAYDVAVWSLAPCSKLSLESGTWADV